MLKSMTAYGRKTVSSPIGQFDVEIQSVNKKFLDVSISLPKELTHFETEIRKWVGSKLNRGRVIVRVSARFEGTSPLTVTPNLVLAHQIKRASDRIAQELNIDDEIGLEELLEIPDVLQYTEDLKDEDAYRQVLEEGVLGALEELRVMKEQEGSALETDIRYRLNLMEASLAAIEAQAPQATEKCRKKLIECLENVLPGCVENEERILREVAVYAERMDITEEIVRFRSHLEQFGNVIEAKGESVGKTLEFLLQELNREANTIGSKSGDIEVTQHVIAIKGELEKIREQIQNVE